MSEPIIKVGLYSYHAWDNGFIVVTRIEALAIPSAARRVVVIDEETALNDPNLKEKIRAALKK